MKTLCTSLMLVFASCVYGQEKFMSVVEAERIFARYAIDYNTRDAFLKFMDTGAVVFDKGEVLKARTVWEAKKPNKAKLTWEPAFAVLSTGGDLGITTGPWQFKPEGKDSVVATGEFSTVWVQKDSLWKWVVDIGIEHNQKVSSFPQVAGIELNHVERTSYPALRYMLTTEENFNNSYATSGKDAYRDIADKDIYFVTNGFVPVQGIYQMDDALTNISGSMKFMVAGSGCSKDGDIGYVYGYVTDKDKKGNYLRVWRRIGRKWTLLLQTLTI